MSSTDLRFSFHSPLNDKDSESQTFGCRHTNPDICGKNRMNNVCAFVRKDSVCTAPPASWKRQFGKLKELK